MSPGSMGGRTKRGRSPSRWLRRSSANCSWVRLSEVFWRTTSTLAVWSTMSRAGWTVRVAMTLFLLRLAMMPASNGNATRSIPTRVISANPSRRPPTSKVRPAATKARPRVVSTSRIRVTVLDRPLSVCRSAHRRRNGNSPDDLLQDIGVGASGHLGLPGWDHAVGQDGLNQRLHIVGKDVVASRERGIGPGRAQEVQAGAWGSTQAPVSYTHLRAHE